MTLKLAHLTYVAVAVLAFQVVPEPASAAYHAGYCNYYSGGYSATCCTYYENGNRMCQDYRWECYSSNGKRYCGWVKQGEFYEPDGCLYMPHPLDPSRPFYVMEPLPPEAAGALDLISENLDADWDLRAIPEPVSGFLPDEFPPPLLP